MLVDEKVLLSIDVDHAGSEKSSDFSFLLLELRGMHLKETKKNFYQFFE